MRMPRIGIAFTGITTGMWLLFAPTADAGSLRIPAPDDLSTARVTEAGSCLHPHCGQINPLSCYCGKYMDAETRERYRTEYA